METILIIAVIVGIILYLFMKKGSVENSVKMMLTTYRLLKTKYSNLSNRDFYKICIKQRLGYENIIDEIIEEAEKKGNLNYRNIVYVIMHREYIDPHISSIQFSDYRYADERINKAIKKYIPEEY